MASAPALNPLMFREYDIRGLVDRDLNEAVFTALGQGFARFLQGAVGSHPRVVVGRDGPPKLRALCGSPDRWPLCPGVRGVRPWRGADPAGRLRGPPPYSPRGPGSDREPQSP
ncbi:MAG: hypothetical protein KatS3mg061_2578 [Dehalococcoidia bacterium]|nr:MAG: hypothetical protein KatS3mg061_2578 [Dehalococcoidia bacterium]